MMANLRFFQILANYQWQELRIKSQDKVMYVAVKKQRNLRRKKNQTGRVNGFKMGLT
jgi:hypothetical protein